MIRISALASALLVLGCSGSRWVSETPYGVDTDPPGEFVPPDDAPPDTGYQPMSVKVIGGTKPKRTPQALATRVAVAQVGGHSLGIYRNTYYDFPAEADFEGQTTGIFDAQCRKIADVPQEFHDTLCVQGSGHLADGSTVSFAKRDCSCARVCPKTSAQICYDQLEKVEFPWGRGATGKAIVPLLTVAADTSELPLGTAVYIPEYDGLPRDNSGQSFHDGCFIVQDRGSRVKGKHVDVFTGETSMTKLWNGLVPSNSGVHVIQGATRCERY